MKLRSLVVVLLFLPLVALAACGGGGGGTEQAAPAATTESTPAATAPDLSNAGGIAGKVVFNGEAPAPQPVSMAADPYCQSAHSEAVTDTPVVVGEDGGLANVLVYVSDGLGNWSFPVPEEPAVLDQQGCLYHPHVLAVRAGQTVVFRNDDDTLHNINVQPADNPAFNTGQPVAGMTIEKVFENPEIGIPARCDVHPWMSAYIHVLAHPYFAVTGTDGAFDLGQLPPGEYVVSVWHETLGTQTQTVTVNPGETAELSISFGS